MTELLTLYWPKLISGAWFIILNLIFMAFYGGQKKHLLERFVSGFLISPSFLSIIGEQIVIRIYQYLILTLKFNDKNSLIFIILNITFDALFIFIGGMIFTYCTGMDQYLGATIYMQFVCIERLALIVSVSYAGYVIVFFILQAIVFLSLRKDMPFLYKTDAVNWKNVFIYLVGLFYVLDLLYASYFLFPELGTEVLNMQSVFWLYSVAIISSLFALGYERIAIAVAKEYDSKILYFKKLQTSQENIIVKLTEISEAKSGETGQHVRRVAEYSRLIAQSLNLSYKEVETIKIAAMMHDLGKLLISSDIIEKTEKLTDEEYKIMQQHAQYGWDIMSNSDGEIMEMARIIALEHHEKWDGTGYPQGLKGGNISIYAQIVSVADVFDALTSTRSYKEAWSLEAARTEILNQRGKQFSPTVIDAFIRCFDEIKEIKNIYLD